RWRCGDVDSARHQLLRHVLARAQHRQVIVYAAAPVANLVSMPARFSMPSNPLLSTDFAYASSGATTFFVTSASSESFSETIPSALPVCMIEEIWKVLLSRIRLLTADVTISTSSAATRPPPIFLHSVCAMTARSDSDSMVRICDCRSA